MSGTLTRTVLAGGRIFPAGTARADAPEVPDGPWWSEPSEPEPEQRTTRRTKKG